MPPTNVMESQSLQRKTEEIASPSQSDLSSHSTIVQSLVPSLKGDIQDWLLKATEIIRSLQDIPYSYITRLRLSIEEWLGELEEIRETACLPQLLHYLLSFAEIKAGRNFRLEEKDQHFEKSNKLSETSNNPSEKSNNHTYKAPEARNSPAWKGIKAHALKVVDEDLNANALTKASEKMPEVRLVIRSAYIGSEDLKPLKSSIRYLSEGHGFKHMFGVVQNTVDFTVKTNFQFAHMKPFGFWCDIIYDPASDDCYLYNRSGSSIYLMSSKEPPQKRTVQSGKWTPIYSGAWRVSITHGTTLYPIFDVLVRNRSFSISADNDKNVLTGTSILDLADGETIRITDLRDAKKTYDLTRLNEIADLPKTSVFSCQHSEFPGINLVAKVFRWDKKHLVQIQMRREMELLRKLHHRNIISLLKADTRLLTLYLEHLPLSLDKNNKLERTWTDAETILFDISSALTYLSKQKIIHYDVKPANIAFSRKRGAILFDFDFGDYSKPKYGGLGGTFGYLPPETIEPRKTRGLRGDVWALGVTILWIVGRYIPTYYKVDDVDDFHRPDTNVYKELKTVLRLIDSKRNSLDRKHNVQDVVYKMLEPKSEARVAAAAIHRKLQDGQSAKKRKHASIN
ncbi:kinase-like domain-containing protein [Trichoderma chlorosporum]